MGWENWPQSNWHELNLDWMLKTLKDLSEKVTDDYSKIYKTIADADSATLAKATSTSKNYTDSEINKLRDNLIKEFDNDILNLNNQIKLIYNYVDSGDSENRGYIDFEILRIYKNLDTILKDRELKVYNPCRGYLETAEKCINDLYTYLAVHGPSALDSDYFTVSDIDIKNLTTRTFDLYSRKRLINVFNDTKMFSPYDGLIKTVQNEVGLNALKSQSISPPAQHFDDIQVMAVEYLDTFKFDFKLYDQTTFEEVRLTNVPSNIKFDGKIEAKNHVMTLNAVWTMENVKEIPANLILGTLVGQGFKSTTLKALLITDSKVIDYDIAIRDGGRITVEQYYNQGENGILKIYISTAILY